jgi:hypothetical protein
MDAVVDYEASDAFYRAKEGGKFFNAFVLGKREKGATPISEGERSTWDDSWFPCVGATLGCSNVTMCGGS